MLAHLKIFTRGHTQLSLSGGEEVLREEEVKDEEDEDEMKMKKKTRMAMKVHWLLPPLW